MDESALKTLLDNLEISRSSLHGWLHFWTFLVVVGVALEVVFVVWEYVKELQDFRRGEVHPPEKPSLFLLALGLLGAGLVAVGVAGELYIDVKAGKVETDIRNANELRVSLLSKEAGDAKDSAQTARDAAKEAKSQSDQAQSGASKALTIAQEARKEADSFEQDIASAKEQAAKAESHLAEAQREAAQAEEELKRIRSPRSLIGVPQLIAALTPLKGTEYTLNVFMDDESMQFAKVVAGVLEAAGWVRNQPTGISIGIPTVEIDFDQGSTEHVPACLNTGISLFAHVKEPIETLKSRPVQFLPKTVQAALALKSALALSISPSDERNVVSGILDPRPAEGMPMTICVGKKP